MAARIDRILHNKRAMLLSMEEGLEEGPGAFNLSTIDPTYIFRVALEGKYTGIIVNPGIAEKYLTSEFRDVPIIINLNATTSHSELNPQGKTICTVERAVKLGAQAVGFRLFDGGKADPTIFEEFGRVVEQAHDYGIPVIAWLHSKPHHPHSTDRDAYAARIALELGADAVSLRYAGDSHAFEWMVRSAGRASVFVCDEKHETAHELVSHVKRAVHAGAIGSIHGRSVWQHPKPFSLTRAVHAVVFNDKTVDEALKYMA